MSATDTINTIKNAFVKNLEITLKYSDVVLMNNYGAKYDRAKMLEFFDSGIFDKISIPLYAHKSIIMKDDTKNGYMSIGFIKGFNKETEEFVVSIFGNYNEIVEAFVDPIIFPRITIRDNGELLLVGLAITQRLSYTYK